MYVLIDVIVDKICIVRVILLCFFVMSFWYKDLIKSGKKYNRNVLIIIL